MFELLTPLSYWVLAALWLVILGLYLGRLRHLKTGNGAISVLLTILALDAFRTLFESTYFGLYFNSRFGLLPASVEATLGLPELLIIPKLVNVAAGVIVLLLLVRRWVPRELEAREHSSQRIKSREETYRDFVEGSDDLITRTDPNGKFVFVSSKTHEVFGLSPSECIGMSALHFIHADDRQKLVDDYAVWMRDRPQHVTHENRQVSQSGEVRHLLWTLSPHFDESGELTHINNVGRDITERKRAEEQQQLLATAVEQATESIAITDVEGNIEYVNPAFETLTGYSREEAIGANSQLFRSGQHDDAFYQKIGETLAKGIVWKGQLTQKSKDGSLYEEQATISPVHDSDGRLVNYVVVNRDITREAELESRLVQAQKMEAVGTLAGGIAHDFNNLLQVMFGNLEIARRNTPADSPAAPRLERIRTSADRAAELVDQLLSFTRHSRHERVPLRLQEILKQVLTLLRSSLPSTIEIRESIDPDASAVVADSTEIHQVAMNLCTNAYHAMREHGGVLEVSLDEISMGATAASQIPDMEAGRKVRLSVRDTGPGIPAATLERIFDPYFTTKKVGEGTGLGLATVRGIVDGSEGAVTVSSNLGVGTVFEVYFPLAPRTIEDSQPAVTRDSPSAGSERLLLIDDEPLVVEQAKLGLEELGYTVEAYTNSLDALKAFRSAPDSFALVITDQTMPKLTGLELTRELRQIRPALPVILCTGFSDLVDDESSKALGIQKYVSKPVLAEDLAAEVRGILDS